MYSTREPFWLLECWRPSAELETELGSAATQLLRERIRSLIGVDLEAKRERLGNFLIGMPEYRHRMRVWWPLKDKLGLEIRTRPGGPTTFTAIVRSHRANALVSSECRTVSEGLHVFEVPEATDHRAVELYDYTTGVIMDRDAGTPLREVAFTQQIATSTVNFTFNFSDGSPPIHTQTTWGTTMQSRAGRGIAPWEFELSEALQWNQHPSSVDVQNAAWLLTAASVAVLGEHRDSGAVRIDLLDMIGAVCDRHLSLLFWESGNSREWLTLTDCLARALALDSEGGQRRLGELAREVRSPELLCKVLKGGGRVLSDGELATLVKQLRERIAFYDHLR